MPHSIIAKPQPSNPYALQLVVWRPERVEALAATTGEPPRALYRRTNSDSPHLPSVSAVLESFRGFRGRGRAVSLSSRETIQGQSIPSHFLPERYHKLSVKDNDLVIFRHLQQG